MWSRPRWWSTPLRGFSVDEGAGPEPSRAPAHVSPRWADVPPDWAAASERILHKGTRRVLVIGAADTGKSTLCRHLLQGAAQSGRTAALLDTDIGQKMAGPPACVTAVDPHGQVLLFFVGTTNPVLGWKRLVEGTRALAGGLAADVIVVNTSGLLAGPGRRLKAAKIEALRPDLLVALGEDPAGEAILADHSAIPALRLQPSPQARRKTDGEKRAARREAFGRYFTGAAVQGFDACCLPQEDHEGSSPPGLLLGLADAAGNRQGLGILVGAAGETVEILTPLPKRHVRRITPGSLILDQAFRQKPVGPAAKPS
jgi:polynucleotide 5'-hydroxyl-kinase GRC3/NOL9